MPSTKNRILASAMRLLDNGGPGAVTLHAVGDASGISQSAPYRHYEDKRALLVAARAFGAHVNCHRNPGSAAGATST
ncbi:MAG TPA: TetR/AcrR family transcriptional regulator [Roseiarcus sp.]|nr:TetR/AcrR family transcriptional regulator [Roseiarcus sp.]